jgi:serine/threonine-protein kinase HipA
VISSALNVWMNGALVGTWSVDRGSHLFAYADAWLASDRVRSLSLSLPFTGDRVLRGEVVAHYFDNLLPDNDGIRERISRRFRTRSTEAFDLLEAIGRDCVGAVQLLPEHSAPDGWDRIDCEALGDEQVADILRAVPSASVLGVREDDDLFRISMAGAQEKTALVQLDGRWCRPHGATPTTHILKLPLGLVGGSRRVDLSDSIQNEWLCAQIVRELGLPVAHTEMATFGDQSVLVVERFDRAWMDGGRWIARLPQEDFCQALGFAPNRKYEHDGGPGMAKCLQLLSGSADADADRTLFLLTQLAFWLMAATDGHAKNYSIFLGQGDNYTMTPLYDILSMWPYIGDGPNQFRRRSAGLAMAVRSKNAHYAFDRIQTRHWHALALKNGGPQVWAAMLGLVEQVEVALTAVESVLPQGFPTRTWGAISAGMRAQVLRFRDGLSELD